MRVVDGVLDLLFPYRLTCRLCGELLPAGVGLSHAVRPAPPGEDPVFSGMPPVPGLCHACGLSLSRLDYDCAVCGRPATGAGLCFSCQATPHFFRRSRHAGLFEGPLRDALHRFKYEGEYRLADTLGAIVAYVAAREGMAADVIVPVPLHRARQRERGYNQAALLARTVSRLTGMPVLQGLVRTRATAVQANLAPARRGANVAGAFAYRGASLTGCGVILVDDVLTTGSTADACAAVLLAAGAAWVDVVVVAAAR